MKTDPTPIQSEILKRLHDAGGTLQAKELRDLFKKGSLHGDTLTSLEKKGYVKVIGGAVELVESPNLPTDQDQRCSPKLNAEEVAEMEYRSNINLVHLFAGELRSIGSGVSPDKVLNKSIRFKLEVAGMLKRDKKGNWFLSEECKELLHRR